MSTSKHVAKKPVTNLGCLVALANIVVDQSTVTLDQDGKDATVQVAYKVGENEIATVEAPLSLLNDAYIGMVRLWPKAKEVKDSVVERLRQDEIELKKKAIQDKKDAKAKEVAERKAKREEERQAKLKVKEEERAKREQERKEKREAKEKEKAEAKAKREKEAKEKAEQKALAEKLKKESDAKKLAEAANKLQQKQMDAPTAPKVKDAGAKAVAAVKGSSKK